jgi:hypothetical protein
VVDLLVSVPVVSAAAAVTAFLFARDILDRELARDARRALRAGAGVADQPRRVVPYRWYGLVGMAVFLGLVALRFVVLPG